MLNSLPSWMKAHPARTAALIAAVAAVLGWTLGSRAACGTGWGDCSFDTALFEAIGTWLGAIGTVGALLYAARQVKLEVDGRAAERLRHQREEDREHQRSLGEQAEDLADAQMCFLHLSPTGLQSDSYASVQLRVTNLTERPLANVAVSFDDGRLDSVDLVVSQATWATSAHIGSLGLERLPRQGATRLLEREVEPKVAVEFSLGHRRYRLADGVTKEILPMSASD